ncbi:MAG: ABC transporter [Sulfobacillus acidophilus]|uniref:ABC transporter n=1 Tax=Sulfobacillus acidophilus TaxID=53633 RepID=A0A2T2WL32_9FIRM|nr:MAG: ABC transporter [Sulfobacillus acidophilus]
MNPVLSLNGVTLERRHRTILRNISWTVQPDEHWVVMGANGSGKTSLLTLITGYEWPTQGHVAVFGHRYGTVDLRELRKRIGWVSHHLSEWMARDHGHVAVSDLVASGHQAVIGKGTEDPPPGRLQSALAQFDLERLGHSAFAALSQGEKTRVLLARAWMARVELLILDEPCSGLDLKGREQLLLLIQRYMTHPQESVRVIYVTHHPEEIVPGFTHGLVLKDGQVFAQGPLSDILTDHILSEALDVPVHLQIIGGRPWVRVNGQ